MRTIFFWRKKQDGVPKSPTGAEPREQILERENMMLRKKLNMTEIMKEFQTTVPPSHMQTMFFETLHELELKIQKYESGSGLPGSGNLSDLQKDLDRERANIKSLKQEINAKNKMLDDNRKVNIEKDKALKAFETELALQKAHVRHSVEAVGKLQKLLTEHEDLKKKMIEKDSTISTMLKEIENLKKQLSEKERYSAEALEKLQKLQTEHEDLQNKIPQMTLKEEVTEVEKLRSELRDMTEKEQEHAAQINALTRKIQKSERMLQEYEANLKGNQKLLEERNKVIEKLNAENNQSLADEEGKENELSKLRKNVEELEEKYSNEMSSHKKEMLELRKIVDGTSENFDALEEEKPSILNENAQKEKKNFKLTKTIDENTEFFKTLEEEKLSILNEKAEKERELSKLTKTIDENTEFFKTLEEEKLSILNEKAEKERQLSKLTESMSQKEKRIGELETKLNASGTRMEADDALKEKTDEINRLKTELQTLKTLNERIKREKEKLEFTCHDAFDKLEKKEKAMKQKQEEHNKLILRKDETIGKLRKERTMVDPTGGGKANIETKSLVDKYEKTEKELKNAKNEIDELKQRLSGVGGANPKNGNVNITDLSNDSRPSKLSERFSEMYENEWTDAYEEAEIEYTLEEEIIGHLYKTLRDISDFCKTIAEEHAKSIQACVLTIPYAAANSRPNAARISVTSLRQLKELRKIVAPYLVDRVFEHYVDTMQLNMRGKKKTENFIRKCVEICWLMNSQDPPVILDTVSTKGNEFDGDKFRTYTKSGKLIDFIVWPPVLVHKDGPLLCKGVAQAR